MTDDSTNEQDQQALTPELPRPGEVVREHREAAGLSFTEVAEALHMTVHYVKALENDEYEKLPGLTFVKGYFRAYARFLQIDDAEVLECYEAFLKAQNLGNEQAESYRISRRTDQVIMWAVIAAIILVLGLAMGWWFFGRENTPQRVQVERAQPDTAPVQQAAALQQAAAAIPASDSAGNADTSPAEAAVESLQQTPPDDTLGISADTGEIADQVSAESEGISAQALMAEAAASSEPAPQIPLQEETAEAQSTESMENAEPAIPSEALPEGGPDNAVENDAASSDATGTTEDDDSLAVTITDDGARNISLLGEGDDLLQLIFSGNSWVEVGDAVNPLLYNDLLGAGDQLNIQSRSPFYILLGDATQVEVLLNERPVNISSRIRSTNSARFMLSAQGAQRWVVEQ